MTGSEAIEVLKNMLGEDDREDEAIDVAISAIEIIQQLLGGVK